MGMVALVSAERITIILSDSCARSTSIVAKLL